MNKCNIMNKRVFENFSKLKMLNFNFNIFSIYNISNIRLD